jgi:hypothetical protein
MPAAAQTVKGSQKPAAMGIKMGHCSSDWEQCMFEMDI